MMPTITETGLAYKGTWNPSGAILCCACQSPGGDRGPKVGPAPYERMTRCDKCDVSIWCEQEVAECADVRDAFNAFVDAQGFQASTRYLRARVEQTGGMCIAVGIYSNRRDGAYCYITADCEGEGRPYRCGFYRDEYEARAEQADLNVDEAIEWCVEKMKAPDGHDVASLIAALQKLPQDAPVAIAILDADMNLDGGLYGAVEVIDEGNGWVQLGAYVNTEVVDGVCREKEGE